MIYLYATLITLLNLVFWASILFGMPGGGDCPVAAAR